MRREPRNININFPEFSRLDFLPGDGYLFQCLPVKGTRRDLPDFMWLIAAHKQREGNLL
jgi:hypothetical protein